MWGTHRSWSHRWPESWCFTQGYILHKSNTKQTFPMVKDQKKFMNRRDYHKGTIFELVLKKKQRSWLTLEECNLPQWWISVRNPLVLEATSGFAFQFNSFCHFSVEMSLPQESPPWLVLPIALRRLAQVSFTYFHSSLYFSSWGLVKFVIHIYSIIVCLCQ